MSLDNIQLPPIVLQGLYKNFLVDLKSDEKNTEAGPAVSVSYLGNNQKKITIVVTDKEALYLTDELLTFLLGVLSACKLSMADVALVNAFKNPQLHYTLLQQQLAATTVLLFGVEPQQLELPLQFPFYQIQKFNNQAYLTAPALPILQNDKEEKIKLWNCLKQLFVINQ